MSYSINSNTGSQQSNVYLNQTTQAQNKSIEEFSSAKKTTSAADDAAALVISDKLLELVASSGQAIQNSNESVGMLQVADGGLASIEDNTQKIRTLTIKADNGTLNSDDRASIQKEIDALTKSSNDIASNTSFNGINLLDGSGGSQGNGTFTTQTGANAGETQSVTIADARSSIANVDVTTQAGRDGALQSIDDSLKNLGDSRSDIGSAQNALISSMKNTQVTQVNAASAASQMQDVDFAKESANFSSQNLLAQSGSFAQSQANSSRANLGTLLA